jgi:hypothetical protein
MRFNSLAAVAALAAVSSAQNDGDFSPPKYPSPWMRGGNGWQDAYAKAQAFVSQLTLLEKVNLTTGVGWEGEACVGNTGSIPRLNFAGKPSTQLIRNYISNMGNRTVLAGFTSWDSFW